jgi:tetratricopeptide (TPR) repeat protein
MEEQERLFRSVTHFIQALAELFPVAVLLDDLQWADAATLDLLQSLARDTRANRVLLLGTYRDIEVNRRHPLGRTLRELSREHLTEEIPVRRLDQEGTAALTAITFEAEEISPEFAELLQNHTEGNPFFLQEVLRALVERGDLYREEDRWERREIAEIEVPKSLRDAIGERLSRLSDEAQEVLYEASVLGQTFDFNDLEAVTDRSEKEVEKCLDEALEAGLIRETGKDEYAFNHALTQQALYAELSGRRKRRLHISVGEALEGRSEQTRTRRAAELAWHFIEGDDPQRALRYAALAGDQAAGISAHKQAEQHYRTALSLARENGEESKALVLLEKLGSTVMIQGHFDAALELLEVAAKSHHEAGDLVAEARVVRVIGAAHRGRGTPQEGIDRIQPLLSRLEEVHELQSLASLYGMLSALFFATGDREEELSAAERAGDLAREVGDEWVLAQAEVSRGTALSLQGTTDEALKVLEESIPLSERSGNLDALARGLNNLAEGYRLKGRLRLAMETRERALNVYEQIGTPAMKAFGLATFGMDLFQVGDWERAESVLRESLDIMRSVPVSWYHSTALTHMGKFCMARGDLETARSYLEEGVEVAESSSNWKKSSGEKVFLRNEKCFEVSRIRRLPDSIRCSTGLARTTTGSITSSRVSPGRMWSWSRNRALNSLLIKA